MEVDQGGNSGSGWTNQGTISVNGGTLRIGLPNRPVETWSNTGSISSTGSTIILSGVFTQAGLGTFNRDAASTVNLDGTLNGGLTLNDTLGAWNLTGSGVLGGTFAVANGSAAGTQLYATAQGGTLNGVTLSSPINLTTNNGATVTVTGGLTVNAALPLGDPSNAARFASITFGGGNQTLGGTGSLVFGASSSNQIADANNGVTLTIGSGLTVRGQSGELHLPGSTATLSNSGTIQSDVSGGTVTIDPAGTFTNNGTVAALSGGTTVVNPATLSNFSGGSLTGGTWQAVGNSTLRGFSSGITTDAAAVLIDGSGSHVYTGTSGTTNALSGVATINPAGSFTIQNSATFTAPASNFSDAGVLAVGSSSTFTAPGGLTVQSSGTLALDVGGTSAGQYSVVGVTGTATLAGTLAVNLVNGFTLSGSTPSIQPLTYTSHGGRFAALNSQASNGLSLVPNYQAATTSMTLQTEPAGTTDLLDGRHRQLDHDEQLEHRRPARGQRRRLHPPSGERHFQLRQQHHHRPRHRRPLHPVRRHADRYRQPPGHKHVYPLGRNSEQRDSGDRNHHYRNQRHHQRHHA